MELYLKQLFTVLVVNIFLACAVPVEQTKDIENFTNMFVANLNETDVDFKFGSHAVGVPQDRDRRQILAAFSRIAHGILESVSGADLSSFLTGIKGIFGSSSSQFLSRHGHNEGDIEKTGAMVPLLQTFMTGQLREETEEQTKLLRESEESEKESAQYQFYTFVVLAIMGGVFLIFFVAQILLLKK